MYIYYALGTVMCPEFSKWWLIIFNTQICFFVTDLYPTFHWLTRLEKLRNVQQLMHGLDHIFVGYASLIANFL